MCGKRQGREKTTNNRENKDEMTTFGKRILLLFMYVIFRGFAGAMEISPSV